ncbi:MAG: glycosyltransferase [Halobacteriota archaeon]
MTSDIAIAHWGEHCNGGGERVAWELARTFDAPLFVGTRTPDIEPNDSLDIRGLFDDGLMGRLIDRGGLSRMLAYQLGWQVVPPLREYDTLVTSGNEPLFYVAPEDQMWVAYVHHTNRKQSDLIDQVDGGLRGTIEKLVYYATRIAFDHNTNRPDLFVANSEVVKRRMRRYWGIPGDDVRVVYPPVDVDSYGPEIESTGDYYLTLSRLDWHKRIDQLVRAFDGLDERLVVAGTGSEYDRIAAVAGDNVEFVGYVSETEKRRLLSGAKAFCVNALAEDFGITTVEALASGTPVIGVDEGFTGHLVLDGRTGYTYDRGVESLRRALERFESRGVSCSASEIAAFADRFSVEAFRDGMRRAVSEARERSQVTTAWEREGVERTRSQEGFVTDGGP